MPRVSTDGDPHEILTLVACVSGLVVAVILIIIIVMTLGCGNVQHTAMQLTNQDVESDIKRSRRTRKSPFKRKMTIFTIFGGERQSFNVQAATANY